MIHFRDRSFCCHSSDCGNEKCTHHLSNTDRAEAVKWWGGNNPPIAFVDCYTEDCGFVEIELTKEGP